MAAMIAQYVIRSNCNKFVYRQSLNLCWPTYTFCDARGKWDYVLTEGKQEAALSQGDRAMPLYISIRIEFYNGIARFLCHSTAFTSTTVQMLKLHTVGLR